MLTLRKTLPLRMNPGSAFAICPQKGSHQRALRWFIAWQPEFVPKVVEEVPAVDDDVGLHDGQDGHAARRVSAG